MLSLGHISIISRTMKHEGYKNLRGEDIVALTTFGTTVIVVTKDDTVSYKFDSEEEAEKVYNDLKEKQK